MEGGLLVQPTQQNRRTDRVFAGCDQFLISVKVWPADNNFLATIIFTFRKKDLKRENKFDLEPNLTVV